MKPGRLETDREYAAKIQKAVYELVKNEPEKMLPIFSDDDYRRVVYVNELKRYLVINEFGTIKETANGWGYKSFESARKALLYADIATERAWKQRRKYGDYHTAMELAESYYGCNQADFY